MSCWLNYNNILNVKEMTILKKLILMLFLLLAMSANCFAAGASKDFAAEESAADALVGSLMGGSVSYEQASKGFSAGLKQNLPAAKFAELKKTIGTRIGAIKNANFVVFSRRFDQKNGYTNVDDLIYVGNAGNGKLARIVVTFAPEKNTKKIASFQVIPVTPAKK